MPNPAADRAPILQRLGDRGRVRVIVAGGGTGGHTYPAVAAVRALRDLAAEAGASAEVLWVGVPDSLEQRVAAENDIEFTGIRAGKLRRDRNPLKMLNKDNARDALRVPVSVLTAQGVVRRFRPDAVLCTGGYVCAPIGMAAALRRRPLVIHEQTTGIGKANLLLARMADRIALSSDASVALLPARIRDRALVTGNPIRPALTTGDAAAAVKALDWDGYAPGLPTVYITGGAQGAVQINDLIQALMPELLNSANVIHQCGRLSYEKVRDFAATLPADVRGRYLVREFIGPELPDVLALTDVVVSRSGAGTLAELTTLGKPSVLIPYPHSVGGEQIRNARILADHNAARALVGDDATVENLRTALTELLTESETRAAVSAAARALGHPRAAEHLALTVLDLATR
ncbi:UDP-N-acetylglucosamine--N-acetylmuramyl-(pentapeptide) pyrophosphoryl-undecaprenol N-acetylglucosamine transferase [Nocardia seriolae]|uniref:UDP-N-acetylglucosamine--N-acetylmuramyl-(pentapeptide) pyrophosphoryl-undecaprenol N-acetylglucosamine transferase n=1 Tax=Nocardia seriolae TaxID=37332 RepID=A0A0B8NFQ5_9NOCA|nr:UDP-N-acetylglucosamine--N-acetylmuramyl-(pentapeptide) pyrophosphoryl-undecaprenol N-acetylglucosamine transferase [Nocardia seriolae]APA96773.1 Undecaprenyldiphospho-muramoylpentapeptide beta-N-acetylglucosaminyltransferase [Nocardia seriolae]MTJ61761.1 UDP-N-acetylglucosamine--N-acetylmuramyl-(pentapeptide) pyrophosphoryl-undecaprenol N-acetylglucosamine transferase [Nocardia seriolae]MTJ76250.1 UDP-N-acetylglucosamine--N-acetylmuramyl-(pentapeptide) pyrophosphoryl-undecaprenol N-acetylglu